MPSINFQLYYLFFKFALEYLSVVYDLTLCKRVCMKFEPGNTIFTFVFLKTHDI